MTDHHDTERHRTGPHVTDLLAGYSLDILAADERHAVDTHLAGCGGCRTELAAAEETTRLLALIPADEALRDFGDDVAEPNLPVDDDLVLRRTLRAVRAERRGERLRRTTAVAAGVAVLVAASLGAGFALGGRTDQPIAKPTPSVSATIPPGTRVLTASDSGTGVRATVTVTPAAGWVRLGVKVTGVTPGEHCQLVAVTRSGTRIVAGSWVVAGKGSAPDPPPVPGAAAVAPADLAAVEVVTAAGTRLVTVEA